VLNRRIEVSTDLDKPIVGHEVTSDSIATEAALPLEEEVAARRLRKHEHLQAKQSVSPCNG